MLQGKFWLWFARIVALLGLLTGGLALHDYLTTNKRGVVIEHRDGSMTIEQTVDPETLERYRDGDGTIRLEKGITILPEEEICYDTGSGSDQTDIHCD